MDENRSLHRRPAGAGWAAALLAIPLGFASWWHLRDEPAPELAGPGLPVLETRAQPIARAPSRAPASQPLSSAAAVAGDTLPDGLRIAPANFGEPHPEGMLPHPITPQHQRIFRENTLIGQLNGAMDVKDARGMRELLNHYREEYPEDANVLQDGYELVADCLEKPGPQTRSRAQRYYDEQLDSGLRRYIRRHCLED